MSSKYFPTFSFSDHNFLLDSHGSHTRYMAISIIPPGSDNFSNIMATSARVKYGSPRNINFRQRPVTYCLGPTIFLSTLLSNSLSI